MCKVDCPEYVTCVKDDSHRLAIQDKFIVAKVVLQLAALTPDLSIMMSMSRPEACKMSNNQDDL